MKTHNQHKYLNKFSALSIVPLMLGLSLPTQAEQPIRSGTIIYKLNENATADQLRSLNALMKGQGFVGERTLPGQQLRIAQFNRIGQESAIAQLLKTSGLVEFAEVDYAMAANLTPNDPYFTKQWHHTNIQTPLAWDSTTGNPNVLVGVCDTGVDIDHPDLINNLRLDLAKDIVNNNSDVSDAHGHGSGTIGTIGASGNNSTGVAGVNWDVDILPLQINISDNNSAAYLSDMATCVEYAADQGARIVNVSYDGVGTSTMENAGRYLRDRNGLLFMSAGNTGKEQVYPDFDSIIAVGATDQNNAKASFSDYGTYVDITAPGVDIATTYKDANYVYYSGTSFSSPIVAGVAALMIAANSNITADEIEQGLLTTATDIGAAGDDNVFGHGLINAQAAINYARNLETSSVVTPISLNTPLNFDAKAVRTKVYLSWVDNNDAEDGFIIERTSSSGVVYLQVPANTTSYAEQPGSGIFSYRVKALAAEQSSDFSNSDTVRIR